MIEEERIPTMSDFEDPASQVHNTVCEQFPIHIEQGVEDLVAQLVRAEIKDMKESILAEIQIEQGSADDTPLRSDGTNVTTSNSC